MPNVNLRVVGMYADVTAVAVPESASVFDVLEAAKVKVNNGGDSSLMSFDVAFSPLRNLDTGDEISGTKAISRVTVRYRPSATIRSRKGFLSGPSAAERAPVPNTNNGIFDYSDEITARTKEEFLAKVTLQQAQGLPLLAWQYYVYNPPAGADSGAYGEDISDDGTIVATNQTSGRYDLLDGSWVVLRLVAIFLAPTGMKSVPPGEPFRASARSVIAASRSGNLEKLLSL